MTRLEILCAHLQKHTPADATMDILTLGRQFQDQKLIKHIPRRNHSAFS